MRPVSRIHTTGQALFDMPPTVGETLTAASAVFSSQIFYYFTGFVLTQVVNDS
jgi:hypothetical protein